MPKVNPEILRWARETAGLDLDEAAEKIDLGAARGVEGSQRLAAMEAGEVEPTRPLLVRMAKQYRRPLLTFYLAASPQKGDRGQDFRTLSEGTSSEDEAVLDVLLRDLSTRQALIRAALEDAEERSPLAWVGSVSISVGVAETVGKIQSLLDFSVAGFRRARSSEDAFRLLRERVESAGAFVLLASNLGSHHTSLGTDVFRGLAIADPIAPFIVVNDQDSRAAWSFTLLHEFTHLLLGSSGVSGGGFDRTIERFCNDVASELLLPAAEMREMQLQLGASDTAIEREISRFASERNLSRTMVAYRLYVQGRITGEQWTRLTRAFLRQWMEIRERQREAESNSESGPSYYTVRRQRLGQALLSTTSRLMSAGALTTVKASQVLGVKPNNVQPLMAGLSVLRIGVG
jgi:Zn-dependent peptidase ImmA (M78 family)